MSSGYSTKRHCYDRRVGRSNPSPLDRSALVHASHVKSAPASAWTPAPRLGVTKVFIGLLGADRYGQTPRIQYPALVEDFFRGSEVSCMTSSPSRLSAVSSGRAYVVDHHGYSTGDCLDCPLHLQASTATGASWTGRPGSGCNVKETLAEAQHKAKRDHEWDRHSKRWKAKHPEAAPRLRTKAHMPSVHHLMLKRAIDVANVRQLCVGWGFICLSDPSICARPSLCSIGEPGSGCHRFRTSFHC